MKNIIEVSGVSKSYQVRKKRSSGHWADGFKDIFNPNHQAVKAVRNVSLTVARGEKVAFIGSNGAGKSTLIKMLTGILVPDKGSIRINGLDPVNNRKEVVKNLGVVFGQRTQLWWDLPITDTFLMLKKMYGISDEKYQSTIEHFKEILDLTRFSDKPVRQLSLGERMRAEITAALLHNPELVLLDEPTIGLDVVAKANLRKFINSVAQEFGTTFLFTSHDLKDIEETCDRVVIIEQGGIVFDGSLALLKSKLGDLKNVSVEFTGSISEEDPWLSQTGLFEVSTKPGLLKATYNPAKNPTAPLLDAIYKKLDVQDISLVSPSIDDIVHAIFEGQGV